MWGAIASAISSVARVAAPILQAGATIYSAYQGRKAAEAQAEATRRASSKAQKQRAVLMASTRAAAEQKKEEIAKQTSLLQSLLADREAKTKKATAIQEQEKKRQRRSLIHTTKDVWAGAAPLIKARAGSTNLKEQLGV